MNIMRTCETKGCGKKHFAKGMCTTHYYRAIYRKKPSNYGPLSDRFWKKVEVTNPAMCWEWQGYRTAAGYGRLWGGADNGGAVFAHRVSYEINRGPIPAGRLIMHTCDNPACVNPAHLELGTDRDNCEDKVTKGRHSHGSRHYGAKLSEERVRFMRAHPEITNAEFSRRYGVGDGVISNARRGITWRHVE